jgi:hypothetical protein
VMDLLMHMAAVDRAASVAGGHKRAALTV